jgi:phosphoenolpyruvate-protein phosphotransferase
LIAVRALQGVAAAPGVAVGVVRHVCAVARDAGDEPIASAHRPAAVETALRALETAAVELEVLADDLQRRSRHAEAEIVDTGVLMARDPMLRDAVIAAVRLDGRAPASAILEAAELHAAALAALDDPMLAARAADVRSVGRRAARIAAGVERGGNDAVSGNDDAILVTDDLGPADVVELEIDVRAIALARGGVTGHAAIVARSLGLPAVVGLGDLLLDVPEGCRVLVDGAAGLLIVDPAADALADARAAAGDRRRRLDVAAGARDLPAVTRDGHRLHVLANVSSAAELALALDGGAEGVGLLRTELSFLDARQWPTVGDHEKMLEPLLHSLTGRPATVRLLDFGGDKRPPFLTDELRRGVQLLRGAPQALEDQLDAIISSGAQTELRILIPMVIEPDDVRIVRDSIAKVMRRQPATMKAPLVGAMIEVPAAVAMVRSIASCVDFLSIGTNDLTHFHLGLDRATAGSAPAHHPAVLRLVADTLQAARDAGVGLEVCGEAASQPVAMPLLVGLGVDELSVGASRVGEVRRWVRQLDRSECALIAGQALEAHNAAEVEEISAPLRALLDVG